MVRACRERLLQLTPEILAGKHDDLAVGNLIKAVEDCMRVEFKAELWDAELTRAKRNVELEPWEGGGD